MFIVCCVLIACWGSIALAGNHDKDFLTQHWQQPVAGLGAADSVPTSILHPTECGRCHVQQYADWQSSLHSQAMGAGILGQLQEMPAHATAEHRACIRCHAPLQEQAEALVDFLSAPAVSTTAPAKKYLFHRGIICAACHVRKNQWFGPPRRRELAPITDQTMLPHNGLIEKQEFADSRFCASCHQFQPGQLALNGKLLENTYEEWKTTDFAEAGITCQSCHMPNRRHLWRGIHDAKMVRQGITISVRDIISDASILNGKIIIKNTGTGHHFPTYVTPRVVIQCFQVDGNDRELPKTKLRYLISREISVDLQTEFFDNRIPSGKELTVAYQAPLHAQSKALVFRITVEPDAFYTQFYTAFLLGGYATIGKKRIEQALVNSKASVYTLYQSSHAITSK